MKRFNNRLGNPFIKKKELKIASEILKYLPIGGSILEIGCGEGTNYFFLKCQRKEIKYTGIDISDTGIKVLKTSFPEANGVVCNGLKTDFEKNSFDTVLCRDYLHHVDSTRSEAVSEAIRLVKVNGCVLFFESNGDKLLNRIFRFFVSAEKGAKNSTPEKLKKLLSQYGNLSISYIEASFLTRAVGFVVGWESSILNKIFAYPIYCIASLIEKIITFLTPEKSYFYILYVLRKNK